MAADVPGARRADRLGADPAGRQADRPGRAPRTWPIGAGRGRSTQVVDASDAYDGLDPAGLAVEPDDFHPNADGPRPAGPPARRAALAALPELERPGRGRARAVRGRPRLRDPQPARSPAADDRTQSTCIPAGRVARAESPCCSSSSAWSPGRPNGTGSTRCSTAPVRPRLNRADREAHAVGYYEGLIGGTAHPVAGRRRLALRHRATDRAGSVPRGRRHPLPRRRLPPVRAQARHPTHPVRPAVHDQRLRHARRPGRAREARGDLPHRRARLVDGHGLGRAARGHVRQPAGRLAGRRPRQPGSPAGRGGSRC